METIWKFKLEVADVQSVEMPEGATILCVQVQDGEPHLWAKVDPRALTVKRHLETFGTGHNMPDAQRIYIGTYQQYGGRLIFHVFELHKL